MIGTNVKELKIPPNNPVGQHARHAKAGAKRAEAVAEGFSEKSPKVRTESPQNAVSTMCRPQRRRAAAPIRSRRAILPIRVPSLGCRSEISG